MRSQKGHINLIPRTPEESKKRPAFNRPAREHREESRPSVPPPTQPWEQNNGKGKSPVHQLPNTEEKGEKKREFADPAQLDLHSMEKKPKGK